LCGNVHWGQNYLASPWNLRGVCQFTVWWTFFFFVIDWIFRHLLHYIYWGRDYCATLENLRDVCPFTVWWSFFSLLLILSTVYSIVRNKRCHWQHRKKISKIFGKDAFLSCMLCKKILVSYSILLVFLSLKKKFFSDPPRRGRRSRSGLDEPTGSWKTNVADPDDFCPDSTGSRSKNRLETNKFYILYTKILAKTLNNRLVTDLWQTLRVQRFTTKSKLHTSIRT
jgi:hypothetical protein